MLVLSLRSTAPARDKVTLVLALRRLWRRGLRRKLAVPIATIREANLLRHSTALLVVQRPASAGFSSVCVVIA